MLEVGRLVNDAVDTEVGTGRSFNKPSNCVKHIQILKNKSRKNDIYGRVWSFFIQQREIFKYNIQEILKRKCRFCVGLMCCILVVISIVTSISVSDSLPLIFLRLAENESGQQDFEMRSSNTYGILLNYTALIDSIKRNDQYEEKYSLSSPRIHLSSTVFSYSWCKKDYLGKPRPVWNSEELAEDTQWFYDDPFSGECASYFPCVHGLCKVKTVAYIIAFDTILEKKMGFGRKWKHDKLSKGETVISEQLAGILGAKEGDFLLISVERQDDIRDGWHAEGGINHYSLYKEMVFPVKIVGIESTFDGKHDFGSFEHQALYMEYEYLFEHIGDYLSTLHVDRREVVKKISPYTYANSVHFNIPEREKEVYNTANFGKILVRVMKFCGEVMYLCGYEQVTGIYHITSFLEDLEMIGLFLRLIVDVIIAILVGLSVVMIYSLMMISVKERTYEMGVLRMIGLKRSKIASLIVFQSFMYSCPSIFIGLMLGQGIYVGIALILENIMSVPISYSLTTWSIILSILIVTILPLLAAILPIRKALGISLANSLDQRRSKTKAIKIKIERSTQHGVSWSLFIVAAGFFVFGFFIYYFFPLALVTNQFELLLLVFFVIIVVMLFGCIILSLNFERALQIIVTYALFFWEKSSVVKLIRKNLVAHKTQNRKTILMFGLSLGFLIFVSVSTKLEIKLYEFQFYKKYGTRLVIETNWRRMYYYDLNYHPFLEDIDELMDEEKMFLDYAYNSFPISWLKKNSAFELRSIGGIASQEVDLIGVSPNFYSVLDDLYLRIHREDSNDEHTSGFSVCERMYTSHGSSSLIGDRVRQEFVGVQNLEENVVLQIKTDTEMYPIYSYFLMRFSSVLDSGAHSTFTRFSTTTDSDLSWGKKGPDIFVSFPTFIHFLDDDINDVEDIPIRNIFLQLDDSIEELDVLRIKGKLRNLFHRHDKTFLILRDVEDSVSGIKILSSVLNLFSYLSTALVMVMCFFSLSSNMYTNIKEQKKEIAILRAVGCKRCALRRIYVYEGIVIIYVASIVGMLCGTFIGYTLVLQQQLFTELPIVFVFPWQIVIVVVILGSVLGFLSSICPINICLRKKIVMILK